MCAHDPWNAIDVPPLAGLMRPLKNLDALLSGFVRYPGLYLVGSGASLPFVPLAGPLDRFALPAYLCSGGFSTQVAEQDDRRRRVISHYVPNHEWDAIFDREL